MKTAQQKHAIWQSFNAVYEGRCLWSFSGQKLAVLGPWRSYKGPFVFESVAKLFDDTSCTQSKSLRVIVAIEWLTL